MIDLTAPDQLDEDRRSRLIDRFLIAGMVVAFFAAVALARIGEVVPGAAAAFAGGVVLLLVRAFSARVPDWLRLLILVVVVSMILLIRPSTHGEIGGSAYFVGVVILIIVACAPRRHLLWAYVAVAFLVILLWWFTWGLHGTSGVGGLSWIGVVIESAILIATSLFAVELLLALADEAVSDQENERARVRGLVETIDAENAQLERRVIERTEYLEAAVKQRDRLAAELREAGFVDPGSGLTNERRWNTELPVLLTYARERGNPVSIMVLDLDNFSEVNNLLGHPVGDEVIRRVAAVLPLALGESAIISRIGGEEFGAAMIGLRRGDARARAELLQSRMAALPWHEIDPDLWPTFSAGIIEVGPDAVGDASSVAREAVHRAH
jgi:diguanylate cyclase (GGDEF)-like protein